MAPLVTSALERARATAEGVESNLDQSTRKSRGQYFTSLPVASVLAAISLRKECRTVIDPMAGHGALLDAVLERATEMGVALDHALAIELEPVLARIAQDRLDAWVQMGAVAAAAAHHADAFDPEVIRQLGPEGFDLVIGNPPYVRYQQAAFRARAEGESPSSAVRHRLDAIVAERAPAAEQELWHTLVRNYSGLSDLSVPSWLLSALLVRPGGVLALVVPVTWRARDYAEVIRYLMRRCFRVDRIVSDVTANWFSTALVRTELVVGIRSDSTRTMLPLRSRNVEQERTVVAEVGWASSVANSLLGAAFPTEDPGRDFARWLETAALGSDPRPGLHVKSTQTDRLIPTHSGVRRAAWLAHIEGRGGAGPFDATEPVEDGVHVPEPLVSLLPVGFEGGLQPLASSGVTIGQGLRTGCNDFFYVEFVEPLGSEVSLVRLSAILGGDTVPVPSDALLPVIRRQSGLGCYVSGLPLSDRILDLRGYVLPDDVKTVEQHRASYATLRKPVPRLMPPELAAVVGHAAKTAYGRARVPIPRLSAVRTNVRPGRAGAAAATPRFWYMLPTFARRHRPDVFVARVNAGTPTVYANTRAHLLVDANFSTLWVSGDHFSSKALTLMLNSTWARACMEFMGTVLGGGALKLEATHLRRLPVPRLSGAAIDALEELPSHRGPITSSEVRDAVDCLVLSAVIGEAASLKHLLSLRDEIWLLTESHRHKRQPR